MNKLKSFISVLGIVLKWAGVAMVLIRTVQYFSEELKKELGTLEAPEPSNTEADAS